MRNFLKKIRKLLIVIYKSTEIFIKGIDCIIVSLITGNRTKPEIRNNREVVLLGNGPSVNDLDLDILSKKYEIACVNFFATRARDTFFRIKPCYYILIDPAFFGKMVPSMDNKYKQTLQHEIDQLRNVLNEVNWNIELIGPQGCSFFTSNPYISIKTVTRMSLCGDYLKRYIYFLYRHNFASCGMQTVLTGALYYFVVNRYQTVYLGGVDMSEFMSYKIDEHNHLISASPHFYGKKFVDNTANGNIPLGNFYVHLGLYAKMLKEYYYLNKFADFQGVKIFNLSLDSYIDSIEKLNWHEIA